MKYKIIDRFIATPIGVAVYNSKNKRYCLKYKGNYMPLYKALMLWKYRRQRRQFRDLEVHHIDGNRFNNSLDNLVAIEHDEHVWIHSIIQTESFKVRVIENTYYEAKERYKKIYKNKR